MRRISVSFAAAAVAMLILGGCAIAPFPMPGFLYTDGKGARQGVENALMGDKTGQSCATSILGLVATGDTSIAAAMKAGGISKITSIDYSSKSIFFIYAEHCTIVTGS